MKSCSLSRLAVYCLCAFVRPRLNVASVRNLYGPCVVHLANMPSCVWWMFLPCERQVHANMRKKRPLQSPSLLLVLKGPEIQRGSFYGSTASTVSTWRFRKERSKVKEVCSNTHRRWVFKHTQSSINDVTEGSATFWHQLTCFSLSDV